MKSYSSQQTEQDTYDLSASHPIIRQSALDCLSKNKGCVCIFLSVLLLIIMYIISENTSDISLVMITSGTFELARKSLSTLEHVNDYEFAKIVVVYDGMPSEGFYDFVDQYENNSTFQFIATGDNYGEIYAIDLALKKVQTSYYLLVAGYWNFTKPNFIQNAIHTLKSDHHISQVTLHRLPMVQSPKVTLLESLEVGFSLMPSVHRLTGYRMLGGNYTKLSRGVSKGMAAGDLVYLISMYYAEKGMNVVSLEEDYVERIPTTDKALKPFRYPKKYLYKRSWQTLPQQKGQCEVSLKIDKFIIRRDGLQRFTKKQLAWQLPVNATSLNKSLQMYGISSAIQIGSAMDTLHIKKMKNYDNVTYYLTKSIDFTEGIYEEGPKPEPNVTNLTFNNFKTEKDIAKYLDSKDFSNKTKQTDTNIRLAITALENPNDQKTKQAEYTYYANKYNLDNITHFNNLCIFIQGFNLFKRSEVIKLITSINNQNYTNFKILFAGDENQDSSAGRFRQNLYYYYPRLLNRLIVSLYNGDVLGTAGNHFFHVKRYCSPGDIVVTLNGNSELVGRQAFNVINAVYQRKETWMALFRPLEKKGEYYQMGDVPAPGQKMRGQGYSTDNFLVSFRVELIAKLPLEHVLEFVHNNETNYLKPTFYQTESNIFHVYSLMQMSGTKRIVFQKTPLYFYSPLRWNEVQCFQAKEQYTKMKATLKYPMQQLTKLQDPGKIDQNSTVKPSFQLLQKLKQNYKLYTNCLLAQQNKELKLEVEPQKIKVSEYLPKIISKMKSPNYYFSDMQIELKQGLPFCLLVSESSKGYHTQILQSIKSQNYTNYRVILLKDGLVAQSNIKKIKQEVDKKNGKIYNIQTKQHSYPQYKQLFLQLCPQNSLIMFPNTPLQAHSLSLLNDIHQYQNVWMTYSLTPTYVQINSFYLRVYELLETNDYHHTNLFYLKKNQQELMGIGMLELCPRFSTRLNISQVYSKEEMGERGGIQIQHGLYFRVNMDSEKVYLRHPYDRLLSLSQDYYINVDDYQQKWGRFMRGKQYEYQPFPNSYLTKNDLLQAVQYEQIPYLPNNHYLNHREHAHLNKLYEIDKYVQGDYKEKLVRFCVTVYGRNNTENSRYINILKTLIMQDYPNFHIVFIDDVSDDKTLEESMFYAKKLGFPKQRITFVKNLQRRYATYNIINSAFNFCHEDDVQVRIDGDDAIIGKQIFKLFNAAYQKNPQLWLVYTNFKSSFYTYGMASQIVKDFDMLNCAGGRRRFHFIAPLTTWRVKLIRAIPLYAHQQEYGGWLNTLYDDALQFSFLELAGIDRIKYIPHISYAYNTGYGSNDNSDKEKIKDRIAIFQHVVTMDSLTRMKDINERYRNEEVASVLRADNGTMYTTVQL